MLPANPPALLVLALLRTSPIVQPPPPAVCQDVQRIELSLAPGTSHEICVSPGLLTGFVFDSSVVVDLQDEVRFTEVTRSRTSISIIPPGDMLPGERLRLTARIVEGESTGTTFILVAHSGQATRQVEVYHDKRTRESFLHELAQERAKTEQLQHELERLQHRFESFRDECGSPIEMRRLITSNALIRNGIHAREFKADLVGHEENPLSMTRGTCYRSNKGIAVEVWLKNSSTEPWTPAAVSLVNDAGQELKGVKLWLEGAILPNDVRLVVVEAETLGKPPSNVTLSLREDGPRVLILPRIAVP
ncbi:MAG: DUF2381 family protein [Archangium sp.]